MHAKVRIGVAILLNEFMICVLERRETMVMRLKLKVREGKLIFIRGYGSWRDKEVNVKKRF